MLRASVTEMTTFVDPCIHDAPVPSLDVMGVYTVVMALAANNQLPRRAHHHCVNAAKDSDVEGGDITRRPIQGINPR